MALPIDYTSRDYVSIRADMIAQIQDRLPEWTSRSPNDFGIVLIELFAHIADSMHYYADRVANESFLSTASQRSSVLEIARLLDYTPNGNTGATVSLTFLNPTGSSVVIPQRTRVGTSAARTPIAPGPGRAYLRPSAASVVFETTAALTVPATSSAAVLAAEGIGIIAEAVANSDGTTDQDWDLYYAPVIDGSVAVFVNGVAWQYMPHMIDAADADPAYGLYTDATGYTHITFGDNINGEVPPSGAAITANYRVGGGSAGNVVTQTLVRALSTIPAGVTVSNFSAAAGGTNAETIASIKINAPRSLYTLDRAVSPRDYGQLALRVPGVGKAVLGPQTNYNNAVIYIAPAGGGGLNADQTPTVAWFALRDAVTEYMVDRIPGTTTLTVLPPTYVTINGNFSVVVAKNFPLETTRLAVYPALDALMQFDNVTFGDTLSQGDFIKAMLSVPGVIRANISLLAPNAPGVGELVLENFNTVPPGTTGWTFDSTVGVESGSLSRAGAGTLFRALSSTDVSGTGEITCRYTFDGGPPGGVVLTLTLTDVNGNVFAAGQRTGGIGSVPYAHTVFHNVRWNNITWPGDSTIFDATQVVRYDLAAKPFGAAIDKFWLDDLRAIPNVIEDVAMAFNAIPTTGGTSLSVFTVTATRG